MSTNNNLAIIAAMTPRHVIGLNNKLPWKIPQELQYFKQVTMGKVMIMGKNTFASMNMKGLPGRQTIVLSSQLKLTPTPERVEIAPSLEQALELAHKHNPQEIMIVGGSSIYQQFLPLVNKLYLSIIHQEYAGDSYFPKLDWSSWQFVEEQEYPEFTTKVFERKNE